MRAVLCLTWSFCELRTGGNTVLMTGSKRAAAQSMRNGSQLEQVSSERRTGLAATQVLVSRLALEQSVTPAAHCKGALVSSLIQLGA